MKKTLLLPWRNLLGCVLILMATIMSSTALVAQTTTINISTGSGTTGDGQVDPNWGVRPSGTNAKTVASYAPFWQPTPVAITGARWINRTGTITSQTVGDHTYDRVIRVPSGSNALNLSFSIAYDDDIVSVDIVDPTGMTVENLVSSVTRSTTPTAYYLSNVITRTYNCPKQGDWILRVKAKFLDEVGAFILSGSATITQGACSTCNCPNGQIAGPNLITNGDFSAGNTGFASAYSYFTPRRNSPGPGNYTVQNDTSTYITNNFWVLRGNTGGLARLDSFMVCDGNNLLTAAYRQTIPTTVGRTYQFCVDANNLVRPNSNFTNSVVELWVRDGATVTRIAGPKILTETPDAWETVSGSWTALTTSVSFEVRGTDDFALDNVKLTTCGAQAEPCKANFNFAATNTCTNLQFTNISTGAPTLSYTWNFGDPTSGANNTSTLANPTHVFTGCGTYNVCLYLIAGNGCRDSICRMVRIDSLPPRITCPPNLTVACIRDTALSVTNLATATDNCNTATLSFTNVASGNVPCSGTIQRTWLARDACGNTATCVQVITVRDTVKPTLTCPANVTVAGALPSCRVAVPAIRWLTATDNCGSTPSVRYAISGATTVASGVNDASGQLFNGGVSMVTYTATDNCGNTQTCSFTVTVRCDSASLACPCPNMMAAGPNLVVNGNFSAGDTGFASDYTYFAPATGAGAGRYTVCDSISAYTTNNFWYCTDHTTGSPTGLFLVCDGSNSAAAAAWRQTFTVAANRIYNFCFYAKNLIRPNSGFTNPSIEVWIKEGTGSFVKKTPLPIVLPENPNNWQLISFNWTSSAAPSPLVIEIRSVVSGSGTDFAIDDISLTTCGTGTSTKEANALTPISIVPNPNQGDFTVILPKILENGSKLRVVNAIGQVVQEVSAVNNSDRQTIHMAHTVSSGLYFLQVVSEGKVVAVEKFVKQ
jgi:PKD domain/Secretion system C-terminal sorting domain/HYR domain